MSKEGNENPISGLRTVLEVPKRIKTRVKGQIGTDRSEIETERLNVGGQKEGYGVSKV